MGLPGVYRGTVVMGPPGVYRGTVVVTVQRSAVQGSHGLSVPTHAVINIAILECMHVPVQYVLSTAGVLQGN